MLTHVISCYHEFKDDALNPEPKFRKIASLKYTIENVFTYFQESNGKDVEYFWKKIEEQKLDYAREDKLGKILKRGKINNRIEFDYVTDIIVVAEEEKRISENEAKKLAEMITEITKAQLLTWRLGVLRNEGKATTAQISMAKRNNVDMALTIARDARQMLGGMGITGEYSIMRHMMNLESVVTYEGTHDIHLLITGMDVTGFPAFK